jgi:hypothetical protein
MNAPEGGLRAPRLAVAAALLLGGLAGCAEMGLERGLSGRDAEWARADAPGQFSIVSAGHDRAVVSALGHQVAVEPAEGFCLAQEAIETSDRSAFLLLGDCALEDAAAVGPAGTEEGLDLPPGVPGIITVTISGDPGFSRLGEQEAGLADLQAFVETAEGRALLGRGGDGDQVSVADSRRIGNTLYVLVEDANGGVPVLAPRFWRAFVELNERLAVVTISGFRDRPLPEEEMLRHLGDQVRQLQVANSEPVNEVPVEVAEGRGQARAPAWPSFAAARSEEDVIGEEAGRRPPFVTDLKPTSIIAANEAGGQGFWPVPERRHAPSAGEEPPPGQGGPDLGGWPGIAAAGPPPGRRPNPAEPAAGEGAAGAAPAPAAAPREPRQP